MYVCLLDVFSPTGQGVPGNSFAVMCYLALPDAFFSHKQNKIDICVWPHTV